MMKQKNDTQRGLKPPAAKPASDESLQSALDLVLSEMMSGPPVRIPQVSRSEVFESSCFETAQAASSGLSRKVGHEVSAHFVELFFKRPEAQSLQLPPLPLKDDALVQAVRERLVLYNTLSSEKQAASEFLDSVFKVASSKYRLSPYEAQIFQFLMKEGSAIELFFEPRSRAHAMHGGPGDPEGIKIFLGGRHHAHSRSYTPQEAYETFLHEVAHARDLILGARFSDTDHNFFFNELRANIYGGLGNLESALRETVRCCPGSWDSIRAALPGFQQLNTEEKYACLHFLTAEYKAYNVGEALAQTPLRSQLQKTFPRAL